MINIVGHIVRSNQQPTPEQIRTVAEGQSVAPEHIDHFVRLVQQEMSSLHEGNFARYRLRPSEFRAWRHAVR
jgi:hypothetical protein